MVSMCTSNQKASPQMIASLSIYSPPHSPMMKQSMMDGTIFDVFYPPPLDISGDHQMMINNSSKFSIASPDIDEASTTNKCLATPSIISSSKKSKKQQLSPTSKSKLGKNNNCSSCNRVIHFYLVSSLYRRKCGSQCTSCNRVLCFNCLLLKSNQQPQNNQNISIQQPTNNCTLSSTSTVTISKRITSPKQSMKSFNPLCLNCLKRPLI